MAESALIHGYGDVQITLTWNDGADLDIHVIDPNGEEIYYAHQYSASGGVLDIDDINGYGPENIFWQTNHAPSGNYQVYVHDYNDNGFGSSNYTVLINAFGNTKLYNGSINFDETNHITDFDKNGFTSPSLNSNTSKISTHIKKK